MPRTYRQGRRASQVASTRARIVQAAIDLYTEQGISATTMQQVAGRADVSPGTISNHFPSRDDLDRAIVERALDEMPAPDLSIFDGLASLRERIGRLSRVSGTFLDQAAPWYRMWLREPMLSGPWIEAGAEMGARWDALFRTALGPLADDPDAMAVLRAVMEPAFFEAVRAGSRSTEATGDLIAALLTPWLEAKASGSPKG